MIPCLLLTGLILLSMITGFYTTTTHNKEGKIVSTNWAKNYAQDFASFLQVSDGQITISSDGMKSLDENGCWIQVIDPQGNEVLQRNKPESAKNHYLPFELLMLYQKGWEEDTIIVGELENGSYIYLIGCPVQVSKIVSYVDTRRYDSGKDVILSVAFVFFLSMLIAGIWYVSFITKNLNRINVLLGKISNRTYQPVQEKGFLHEIYDGLNVLEQDISEAEQQRRKNEATRSEWIANITHDLKTPMAPIRGYAELLSDEARELSIPKVREYGKIIYRNTSYAEKLMQDLTLTYQLQNGMLPRKIEQVDFVRFVRELVIDILNTPEYAERKLTFETTEENIKMECDVHLLKRALTNLIVNSLVHNESSTEIHVLLCCDSHVKMEIRDNGKGMKKEELQHLFERYYRGTNTDAKPEGAGLGMAIAKQIIQAEAGTITAESVENEGTIFYIQFPKAN